MIIASKKFSVFVFMLSSMVYTASAVDLSFVEKVAAGALLPIGLVAEYKKEICSNPTQQKACDLLFDLNELSVVLLHWYNSYYHHQLGDAFYHGDTIFYLSAVTSCIYNVISDTIAAPSKNLLLSDSGTHGKDIKDVARKVILAAECFCALMNAKEIRSPRAKLMYKNVFLTALLARRILREDVITEAQNVCLLSALGNIVNAVYAYRQIGANI